MKVKVAVAVGGGGVLGTFGLLFRCGTSFYDNKKGKILKKNKEGIKGRRKEVKKERTDII